MAAGLLGAALVLVGCSTPADRPGPSTTIAPSTARPVAVALRSLGDGPRTVVLVHGGPGTAAPRMLDGFAALAHTGFRVVYYDQRGVGASPTPTDDDYSPDAYIADLEALRVKLGVERLDLIGHSWGDRLVALQAQGLVPARLPGSTCAELPLLAPVYAPDPRHPGPYSEVPSTAPDCSDSVGILTSSLTSLVIPHAGHVPWLDDPTLVGRIAASLDP